VTQFESLYSNIELEKMYGMSLKELILILVQNNSTAIEELNNKQRQGGLFGRNQKAWDFGISPVSFCDGNFFYREEPGCDIFATSENEFIKRF